MKGPLSSALCKALASVSSLLGAHSCPVSEAGWGPEEGLLPADVGPSIPSAAFPLFPCLALHRGFLQGNQSDFKQAFLCPVCDFAREDRFQVSSGVIKPIEITVAHCLHGSAPCASRSGAVPWPGVPVPLQLLSSGPFHRAFPAEVQWGVALYSCSCPVSVPLLEASTLVVC